MGNTDTKHSYREAIVELTTRSQPIESNDDEFWSQFWHGNYIDSIQDVFQMLTAQEIRTLRDESPSNLSTLCYKAVEQLVKVTDTLCNTTSQQKTVLTCVSLLTRILPYIFEDSDWRRFFCSNLPASGTSYDNGNHDMYRKFGTRFASMSVGGPEQSSSSSMFEMMDQSPLAQSMMLALADLLFCPDFTVAPLDSKGTRFGAPDTPPEDLQSIDSCEYIWEAGVGCSIPSSGSINYDQNRTELLRLLLTCFSESMYCSTFDVGHKPNRWIEFFTSAENRHALPLFTSLLNTVFAYNPNSYLPFNHLLFSDSKEPLVEVALQILIVTLDHDFSQSQLLNECIGTSSSAGLVTSGIQTTTQTFKSHKFSISATGDGAPAGSVHSGGGGGSGGSTSFGQDNLFINYISRIHREDDFEFILKGFTRLLNNPLQQSYLPNSTKRIQFHQELLVLFWKICDYNKKFMYYVLKTCDVLKILVPILYHLNDSRADRSRVGLVHIGVFIILLLSGERNFGVRLNRPYLATAPMDLPIFSGTHADLLVIVFHKLITTGHQRLQPLFDCLLTILVNVSPYLKTLSMVASSKILHLLEAFSTPWFLFSNPTNHHLVFFLLEIFNNIIQYQFDGNSNLIYTIIRKRHIFHALSNIPTDYGSIQRSLSQAKLSSSNTPAALSPTFQTPPQSHFRRQSTKSHLYHHRKLTRPLSLAEPPSTSYLHSQQMTPDDTTTIHGSEGGSYSHSQSNPTTPQFPAPSRSFAEFIDNLEDNHHHPNQQQHQSQHRQSDQSNAAQPTDVAAPSTSKNSLNNEELHHHADVHHNPRSISQPSTSNVATSGSDSSNVQVTLAAVPKLNKMIEKTHPSASDHEHGEYEQHAYSVDHVSHDPINRDNEDYDNQDDYDQHFHPTHPSQSSRHAYGPHHSKDNSDSEFANVTPIHEAVKRTGHGSGYQRASSISRQSSTASERTAISGCSGRTQPWAPTSEWIISWKQKLPLQTIMRMLQVLVPQVEKMCIDKGITDENEILKFLQHGTLVGLLPVPHPILIRKYQTNIGTTIWFRTYMWGVIYLRNSDPPIWYDTNVKLFEIQKN